ncbi:MAG: NAD-dependent protein deacylase, partial [Agathobacter sp.]|nr:NAD-dependent protein deacylase [Agathobacter sp.]
EFYDFYRDKMICLDAKPNITHQKLAELEQAGKLTGVVTQNIDGLHQAAGSKKVWELHGSIHRNYCMDCGKSHPLQVILDSSDIPHCECGGIIKPDVVLYEEGLDDTIVSGAIRAIAESDLLIVGGTSLAVYPAAGLLQYFQGKHLALINKSPTPLDKNADLVLQYGLGEFFSQL